MSGKPRTPSLVTLWGMACRLDELRKEVITYLDDHGQVPREG